MRKFARIFSGGRILLPLYLLLIAILTLIIAVVNHEARISMNQYHTLAERDASKQIMISEIIKNAANNELALLHLIINYDMDERRNEVYSMAEARHSNDSIFTAYKPLISDERERSMVMHLLERRERFAKSRDTLLSILKEGFPDQALAYLNTFQKLTFNDYEVELKNLSDYVEEQTDMARKAADQYEFKAMSRIIVLLEASIFIILLLGFVIVRTVKKIAADNRELAARTKVIEDYKEALDQSAVVSVTDEKGIIKYVNDKFCEESGYSREELIGNTHSILNSKYHPKKYFEEMWNAISQGKVWKGELKNKTKKGDYFWADTTIIPFTNRKNRPYQYMAIRNNITQFKTAKEELSKRIHEQETINDQLELLAARFDKAQRIAELGFYELELATSKYSWSDETFRIFGQEPGRIEPSFELFMKYVHPEDLERVTGLIDSSRRTLVPFSFRHRIILDNGKIKNILSTGHFEYDKQNNPVRLFGTCLDITELVKTNSELDRFVYSVSHDLRAPLTSLLGLTNLIEDDFGPADDMQRERVGMMKKSIRRLDTFISDILDYSRNGRLAVEHDIIHFEELVKETRENLKFMEGTDGYNLKIDIRQNTGFISDKKRLSIILNNLISNAIKYQDVKKQSPYVKVIIKTDDDKAILVVEDNGIGIAHKDHEKIFEMFYRASKLSAGSGLGMYIVKETIDKLNGTIQLASQPHVGTRFLIVIPNMMKEMLPGEDLPKETNVKFT
jgi:PAS domain S-box-containing protein